ncbi:MAG: glycoside hydrolase N-terminal domain-containing protein, partial [Phycisphaerales bacterium]
MVSKGSWAVVLVSVSLWPAALMSNLAARPQAAHNLNYSEPAATWDEAMPLGNGLLGALVWGDGHPLRVSLDRTDLWDLRPVPEFHTPQYSYATMRRWVAQGRIDDLHRLYDVPYGHPGPTKIPAGRIELSLGADVGFRKAELDLARAVTVVHFAEGQTVEVLVHATQPFGMIRITSMSPESFELLAPPFAEEVTEEAGAGKISAGDLATLRYDAPERHAGDGWTGYLQKGWGGFRFAVVLAWRQSATGWVGAWSVATSNESSDPLAQARQTCTEALEERFDAIFAGHCDWWQSYWEQASVSVPNAIIERHWYLETYKFGAAARADTPPITLQGPWTADNRKIPPWKGDY